MSEFRARKSATEVGHDSKTGIGDARLAAKNRFARRRHSDDVASKDLHGTDFCWRLIPWPVRTDIRHTLPRRKPLRPADAAQHRAQRKRFAHRSVHDGRFKKREVPARKVDHVSTNRDSASVAACVERPHGRARKTRSDARFAKSFCDRPIVDEVGRGLVPSRMSLHGKNFLTFVLDHATFQSAELSLDRHGTTAHRRKKFPDPGAPDHRRFHPEHGGIVPWGILTAMSQSITFLGAARTVTGSKHLLTLNGKKVLVDCGMFQGPRELSDRNWLPFAFDVTDLDAVVLTHAHQDHIGMLPKLVKEGYRGPIYATPSTIGLCKISLPDSGRIQEEDADYHKRHGTSRHADPKPLYTEADAYEVLKQLVPVHYFQTHELPGGATFRYLPAGHILGAAFAEIYFESGERILMSGDMGHKNQPIIKDPTPVDFAEYLVLESTYGDRLHPISDAKEKLFTILDRACKDNSTVLVPSFAIGRTQELLWFIHELFIEGRLPKIPIYVDSPMANAATLLYASQTDDHDKEMKVDMEEGKSPFSEDFVRFVRDRNMSKQLNEAPGPMMVIAGSGMITGGRIIHHLRHHLSDPSCTVLFTGYQAMGTPGRTLLDGADHLKLLGADIPVRAHIDRLESLSAHADYGDILDWLGNFKTPPRKTFLVHGEPPAQESLRDKIVAKFGWEVVIPDQGDSAVL